MRALSALGLLQAWERGLEQPLAKRALQLLSAAYPEMSLDALAQLSIGSRDMRLLELREWLFGSQMICLDECPKCWEQLELTFQVSDVHGPERADSFENLLRTDGYEVRFRIPNGDDLVAIVACQDLEEAHNLLLARCISDIRHDGTEQSLDQLPPTVVEKLTERMEQADPDADVQLQLACPTCVHTWLRTFDITSFLWREINDWAQRMLREIHILASAYRWRESDILAMSQQRRKCYMDMIGGCHA